MKPSRLLLVLAAFLISAGAASAQSNETHTSSSSETTVVVAGETVVSIKPGILKGYLPEDKLLDSAAFVPPAPREGSARQALDTAWAADMLRLRGNPRWNMAIRDADLSFPAAPDAFACALGFEITEADTPALYLLLWRSMTDIGLSSYSAKNAYQRERPFMRDDTPICTPKDEDALRSDGSYPSGHTAVGWGWALILSELAPERTEMFLERGRAFGESRNVCNVHWYSDVVAGRLVGAAAVARLRANSDFVAAMNAARAEIASVRAGQPTIANDCALEAATLKVLP